MVNNQTDRSLQPPKGVNPSDKERAISVGPIYALTDVLSIAGKGSSVSLVTERCRHNVEDLGWSIDDVVSLISEIQPTNYKDSEWCRMDRGLWLPCDVYVVSRKEYCERMFNSLFVEYYLKFAIGPTGAVLLIVSCHT